MNQMDRNGMRRRAGSVQVWTIGGAILLLAVLAYAWWSMRPNYPEVSSPENLTLMRALYTACSSQNTERLSKVERAVAEEHGSGRMTLQERESFASIIALARAGKWTSAADESYRFAEDQVR
jgi:hypothetical protein